MKTLAIMFQIVQLKHAKLNDVDLDHLDGNQDGQNRSGPMIRTKFPRCKFPLEKDLFWISKYMRHDQRTII